VRIDRRILARFEPVVFCDDVIDIVENSARLLGSSTMRLPSGAGHDAQMLARNCPTAMIFTPSVKGISHNPAEHTAPDDLELGTNVLMHTMWELAHRDSFVFTPGSGT
jgi:N-carbamoyl-L-amino-acid hydrolase